MLRKPLSTALATSLLRMPTRAILSWHLIVVLRPVHQIPAIPFIHHAPMARKFTESATLYSELISPRYTYSAQDGGWNVGYAADPGSPWLHKATDWVPIYLRYIQDTVSNFKTHHFLIWVHIGHQFESPKLLLRRVVLTPDVHSGNLVVVYQCLSSVLRSHLKDKSRYWAISSTT